MFRKPLFWIVIVIILAAAGGGPMLQGTPDPSLQATAQARFSTQANQVNTLLLDVLITRLEALSAG